MKILLSYPARKEEELMLRLIENASKKPKSLLSTTELTTMQARVAQVTISDEVKSYIVRCVEATRNSSLLSYGASPRASLFLMHGAKAVAWLQGRNYVMYTDVQMISLPVIRHRVVLQYSAIAQ
jgi:MoxR-like ATPase